MGQLLLDPLAQQELLRDVKPVFTAEDNKMLTKFPSKDEVKNSVSTSNLHAAPGTDGLTSYLYHNCWDTLGDALTEVVQAIHGGEPPTHSQRTSSWFSAANQKSQTQPNQVIKGKYLF